MIEPSIANDPANITPPIRGAYPNMPMGTLPKKTRHFLRWVMVGTVILVLGAAAYAAVLGYNRGYLASSLIDKWLHREDPVAFMVKSIEEAKSGQFQLGVDVAINESNGTEPLLPYIAGENPAKIQARVAELKSNVAQTRTGLALYYDDNLVYPKNLSELVTEYLSKDVFDDITYAPSSDFKKYSLTGTITANEKTATYTINEEGAISDTTDDLTSSTSLSNIASMFVDYLPEDMKIRAESSYFFSTDDKGEVKQSRGMISGSYTSGGTSFSYNADALSFGQDSYVRINEVPTFPGFDFSELTGKWISLTKEDNLQLLPGDEYLSGFGDVDASSLRSLTSVSVPTNLLSVGLETEYILSGEKKDTVVLDGNKFDRYTFTINPEKRGAWREALINEMKNSCKDENCIFDSLLDDQDILDQIANDPLLDAVLQLQSLEVYIHRNHKEYRMKATTAFRFADTSALKNKAIAIVLNYTAGNFGKSPEVIKPKDVTPFDEAKRQMLGYTSDQWKFMKQKSNITTLRTSLKRYFAEKNEYPGSLDALLQDASETSMKKIFLAQVTIDQFSFPEVDSEGNAKSYELSYIPIDVFTGQPYTYANDGSGYTLTYEMQFPKEDSNSGDAYFSDYETQPFVEGKNTADEYSLSREAVADKDTDYDGLKGREEVEHNTNPEKKDTDGDKIDDFREIEIGSDPIDPTSNVTALENNTLLKAFRIEAIGSATNADYILGPENAKITLLVYTDLECPYCQKFHENVNIVRSSHADLRLVYRHFPLTFHAGAKDKAEAAECVGHLGGNEAFYSFVEKIFDASEGSNVATMEQLLTFASEVGVSSSDYQSCIDKGMFESKVKAHMSEGALIGITGTPTSFVLDAGGTVKAVIQGAQSTSGITEIIENIEE